MTFPILTNGTLGALWVLHRTEIIVSGKLLEKNGLSHCVSKLLLWTYEAEQPIHVQHLTCTCMTKKIHFHSDGPKIIQYSRKLKRTHTICRKMWHFLGMSYTCSIFKRNTYVWFRSGIWLDGLTVLMYC